MENINTGPTANPNNQPPLNNNTVKPAPSVSHAPLSLGNTPAAPIKSPMAPPAAAPKPVGPGQPGVVPKPPVPSPQAAAAPKPVLTYSTPTVVRKPTAQIASSDRITGVKTFFTKLHPGAMDFLDDQINTWLKENPGLSIKCTNSATGVVEGKKAEPSIIITVWY